MVRENIIWGEERVADELFLKGTPHETEFYVANDDW